MRIGSSEVAAHDDDGPTEGPQWVESGLKQGLRKQTFPEIAGNQTLLTAAKGREPTALWSH